jgi:hypothetical protein
VEREVPTTLARPSCGSCANCGPKKAANSGFCWSSSSWPECLGRIEYWCSCGEKRGPRAPRWRGGLPGLAGPRARWQPSGLARRSALRGRGRDDSPQGALGRNLARAGRLAVGVGSSHHSAPPRCFADAEPSRAGFRPAHRASLASEMGSTPAGLAPSRGGAATHSGPDAELATPLRREVKGAQTLYARWGSEPASWPAVAVIAGPVLEDR